MAVGDRARTHSAEFEVDAEELRRRSDEILAMVARLTDLDAEEREVPPETRSSESQAQGGEAASRAVGRVPTNGRLLVREWLALQIGCAARELSVIEHSDESFDVVFSRNGERYGQAYLLAPNVPGGWHGSTALIAIWKPGRWFQEILAPGATVDW